MANVLGTLFSDIANAIRNKTGTTEKIAPKDFPIQINNIVVGGGTAEGEWKFASGELTATEGTMTITHELGSIPDIIYVRAKPAQDDINSETNLWLGAIQFSNAMIKAIGGSGNDIKGISFITMANYGGCPASLTVDGGVEDNTTFGGLYGHIRNANATTFQVSGGTTANIGIGKKVYWWAVSGIV